MHDWLAGLADGEDDAVRSNVSRGTMNFAESFETQNPNTSQEVCHIFLQTDVSSQLIVYLVANFAVILLKVVQSIWSLLVMLCVRDQILVGLPTRKYRKFET